jgi:ubiquinone/menaquinone biosynthesis C-methylase UbiE
MGRLFAAVYDGLMHPLERRAFRAVRTGLLREAHGLVLEVGSGTGINFPLYRGAALVVALEPDPYMRARSAARAVRAAVPVALVGGSAEALPFPDACFDTAVATLVFCTIAQPGVAAREIRRVLKPGGKLLLFEHVKLHRPVLGKLQDLATPVWKHVAGGCHLNRDTLALLEQHGYELTERASCYGEIFVTARARTSAMQAERAR